MVEDREVFAAVQVSPQIVHPGGLFPQALRCGFVLANQVLRLGNRVSVPISEFGARTAYYLACLASGKQKYNAVFNAASQALPNLAKDKITAGFREE